NTRVCGRRRPQHLLLDSGRCSVCRNYDCADDYPASSLTKSAISVAIINILLMHPTYVRHQWIKPVPEVFGRASKLDQVSAYGFGFIQGHVDDSFAQAGSAEYSRLVLYEHIHEGVRVLENGRHLSLVVIAPAHQKAHVRCEPPHRTKLIHDELQTSACGANRSTGSFVVGVTRVSGVVERSEEHTSELQSRENLVCRLLL